jgi:hypothetical protein
MVESLSPGRCVLFHNPEAKIDIRHSNNAMPRVLLITYYFPPSGGPGVQRMLKFARYLESFDWEPVVLTVRDGAYPARDPTLTDEIPATVGVHRTSSWDPYRWYARFMGKDPDEAVSVGFLDDDEPGIKERLARWVRANIFLPDARVGWVPFAVRRGQKLLSDQSIDTIVTSGPPHSTHLIGRMLHRWSGVSWAADFRDPWTDIDYYSELPMTRWARFIDRVLERTVLDDADRIISVSRDWCRLLGEKTTTPTVLIRNGFDPEDFESIRPAASDGFVISHVGNLLPARNPEELWRVLGRLYRSGEISELRIRFVGNVDGSVRRSVKNAGLRPVTEYVPYVPHEKALAYMVGSTLLLLTINRSGGSEFEGHIPGKLYEYLGSGRPVLGIGAERAEVARILEETNGGKMVDFGDAAAIEELVGDYYADWSQGKSLQRSSGSALEPFTRQHQTEQLAALLTELKHGNG